MVAFWLSGVKRHRCAPHVLSPVATRTLHKVYGVGPRAGVLVHLEVVCREAERTQYHVTQVFQLAHHLLLQLLVALLYLLR